jgi:hypothetical protein
LSAIRITFAAAGGQVLRQGPYGATVKARLLCRNIA